ncbi:MULTISPECIES: hypothetical protein [unclassified Paenibacillus]|uniref:hypothetical protein n=1 Tax=unclassified Paenibacillus TaxID=185978 RepID=UPI0036D400B1
MNASSKVVEILNKDEKARKLMQEFNEAAERTGLSNEEYVKAREIVLMLCMYGCKEAMNVMSNEVYEALNA